MSGKATVLVDGVIDAPVENNPVRPVLAAQLVRVGKRSYLKHVKGLYIG